MRCKEGGRFLDRGEEARQARVVREALRLVT